jgi:hypothetical protein
MRLQEILSESMTFGVAKLVDHDGEKRYTNPFAKEQEEDCWYCHGSGKDPHHEGHKCERCYGEGKTTEYVSNSPELNVANANGSAILNMLGLDNNDYSGVIHNKDLPNIRRTLLKLKNSDISKHTQEPTHTKGKISVKHDDELGVPRISRGAEVYDMGRSQSQINRYVDSFLELVTFAQEHGLDITWG